MPYPNNPQAVDSLPDIVRTGYSQAFLLNLDTEEKWHFLLPPQALPYRSTVSYAVGTLLGVNQQPIVWTSSDGLSLELSGLILDTTRERKSVRAAIDRLVSLSHASPALGRPALLSFVWGEQSFSECVLIGDISWTETAAINGVAVRAILGFTLRKAGKVKPLIEVPTIEPIPGSTNSGGIPLPQPNPTPPPVEPPGGDSGGGTSPPSTESEIDKVGFGACLRWSGAGGFVIAPGNKGLTAEHMLVSGKSPGTTWTAEIMEGDQKIGSCTCKLIKADEGLDAAYFEITDKTFDIYWTLGDSDALKSGDLCYAYGFPDGDPLEERNKGVIAPDKGSAPLDAQKYLFFAMPDAKTRLLYPGNSGGAICAAVGSQAGKIISLTSGGEGRPKKTDVEAGRDTTIKNWKTDRCWGPRINSVKQAFGIN